MNTLVVGEGAREHALAWKLRQSPECGDLWVTSESIGVLAVANTVRYRDGGLIGPTGVAGVVTW